MFPIAPLSLPGGYPAAHQPAPRPSDPRPDTTGLERKICRQAAPIRLGCGASIMSWNDRLRLEGGSQGVGDKVMDGP